MIREQALEANTGEYLAADGTSTSDSTKALTNETTGDPVRNPDVDLWVRSKTLRTALMQAYVAFRLSDLMLALSGVLGLAGAGITAVARR